MSDAEPVIDESMTSLRFRDVATEYVLASRERSSADVVGELITLQNEPQAGPLPTLCKSDSRVCLAVVAADHLAVAEGADKEETIAYYLVEQMDSHTTCIIGYIMIDMFDEVATRVREDETYSPPEGSDFVSHADNLVCEPADLILSFRDD